LVVKLKRRSADVQDGIDIPDMSLKRFVVPVKRRKTIQVKIGDFQDAKLVAFDKSQHGRRELYQRIMTGLEKIMKHPGIIPRQVDKRRALLKSMRDLVNIVKNFSKIY